MVIFLWLQKQENISVQLEHSREETMMAFKEPLQKCPSKAKEINWLPKAMAQKRLNTGNGFTIHGKHDENGLLCYFQRIWPSSH